MPRLTHTVIAAAFAFLAGPTGAQEPVAGGHNIPRVVEGERLKPNGSFYSGGYSGSQDFIPYAVHLYEFRNDRAPDGSDPEWLPWAVRLAGSGTQARTVQWVDGRTCPALYGVLVSFADLAPPRFRSPRFHQLPRGADAPSDAPLTIGAPPLAAWGYARQADGALMAMIFTGTDGLIASWVNHAEAALRDCWRSDPPSDLIPHDAPVPTF
jgi:hypothetical protein